MLIYFFICIRMGPKNYAQFSNIITYRGPTMEYLSFHLIFLVFVIRFVKIILLKSCILQCSFTAGLFYIYTTWNWHVLKHSLYLF